MKNFFLLILLVVFLFFFIQFFYLLYNYTIHKYEVPVKIFHWEIKEVKGQKFIVTAHFHYKFKDISYEDKNLFSQKFFNSKRAVDWVEIKKDQRGTVWVDKKGKNPIMEKVFPFKSGLYCIVCFFVLIYFYFFQKIYKV